MRAMNLQLSIIRAIMLVIFGHTTSYSQSIILDLEYFNTNAQTVNWGVPKILSHETENVETQILFQRFDVNKDFGYLDSIRIFIDSVSVNSVLAIGIANDTLFTAETEPRHWPKLFPPPQQLIAQAMVEYYDITPNAWNVIQFPNVKVPKRFHVGVGIGASGSYFEIKADDNEPFELNAETDRSTWLGYNLATQNASIYRLMTTKIENRARYSNLYMTAYVDTNIFVSVTPPLETATSLGFSLSPNPASSHTTISVTGASPNLPTVFSVYDVLGKQVMRTEMNLQDARKVDLDLSGLRSGTYLVRAVSGIRQNIRKLIITQ